MEIVIKQTTGYSKFRTITGNRTIQPKKIEKLCKDIGEGFNMLPYCPIIVSEKEPGYFQIIDGQHRFEASKRTKNPVYYVVCNTLTLKQIALLNSRGDKWTPADFLNCYIQLGVPDYIQLKNVMDKYKVSIRVASDLLMFNKAKAPSKNEFQEGDFKCKYLEETEKLLTLSVHLFGKYAFSMDRYLLAALQTLMSKGVCDFEKLKLKIKAAPDRMQKQPDYKSYLTNIETIYNYANSKREIIY